MPGAVFSDGRRGSSRAIRSRTRAPDGSGVSNSRVPAASRYEAKRRTRTQISAVVLIFTPAGTPSGKTSLTLAVSIEVSTPAGTPFGEVRDTAAILVRHGTCQKIEPHGVLSVNGPDDLAEQNVLNLADPAVAPSTGSPATRFDTLFQRFYSKLFGLVYRVLGDRMETEDTLQETFLKLSDDAELQARPDSEVGAWLRRGGIHPAVHRPPSAKRAPAPPQRVARLDPTREAPSAHQMLGPPRGAHPPA